LLDVALVDPNVMLAFWAVAGVAATSMPPAKANAAVAPIRCCQSLAILVSSQPAAGLACLSLPAPPIASIRSIV
jgi:hypothetical protein